MLGLYNCQHFIQRDIMYFYLYSAHLAAGQEI